MKPLGAPKVQEVEELILVKKPKMFLSIPTAASLARVSIRHFHRRIKKDKLPIIQIGKKFFILSTDFQTWNNARVREQ